MELSKQQEAIVNATEDKVVVVASAAAGKTTVLTERARHLVKKGIDPKKIVVITFTNAAAEELSERLGSPKGMFIGTIHSYANFLLLSGGYETLDILEKEQFDELFERIKKHPKCLREVDYLLLDEAQDSNEKHFEFLLDIIKPKQYMFVGDWRQSLYRWNGAHPEFLVDLTKQEDVTTYDLNENYRNGYKILDFAKNIMTPAGLDYFDTSVPKREESGRVVDVEYSPMAIVKAIKQWGDYGNWFILTRTNDQIEEICYYLKKEGVPYDSFKRTELDNKELGERLKADTVKVLTIHTSKGLEAENVVVIGARFFNVEERCVSYVAATRARDLLVWTKMPFRKKKAIQTSSWEQ